MINLEVFITALAVLGFLVLICIAVTAAAVRDVREAVQLTRREIKLMPIYPVSQDAGKDKETIKKLREIEKNLIKENEQLQQIGRRLSNDNYVLTQEINQLKAENNGLLQANELANEQSEKYFNRNKELVAELNNIRKINSQGLD